MVQLGGLCKCEERLGLGRYEWMAVDALVGFALAHHPHFSSPKVRCQSGVTASVPLLVPCVADTDTDRHGM